MIPYLLRAINQQLPSRSYERAPKPNKNFLRNIIRDTDNHNAALLAKENAEARAKLRTLTGEKDTDSRRSKKYAEGTEGRHRKRRRSEDSERERSVSRDRKKSRRHRERRDTSPEREDRYRKKRRRRAEECQEDDRDHHRHIKRRHEGNDGDDSDDDAKERDRRRNKRRRRHEDESHTKHRVDRHKRHRHHEEEQSEERRSRHSRRHHDWKDRDSSRAPDSESNREHRSRKSRRSNEESRHKHRHESEERGPWRNRSDEDTRGESYYSQISPNDIVQSIEFSPSPVPQGDYSLQPKSALSDIETDKDLTSHAGSDLLEELFGPLPPRAASPDVPTKGRGNLSSTAMDARFTEDYHPSMEMQSDTDQDELEAMRDREQWRLRGADRLRAAGFSEDVIKNWQNGGEKKEGNVEDVKWAKQGEAREWDRGKVLDEQGNVDLKPKWGGLN